MRVLDFGLAKALGSGAAEAPYDSPSVGRPCRGADAANSPTVTSPAMMTGAGVILGTAAYMSPEQARGKASRQYDVSPDGQRFLVNIVDSQDQPTPITLVVNWTAGLKK